MAVEISMCKSKVNLKFMRFVNNIEYINFYDHVFIVANIIRNIPSNKSRL